MYVTAASGVACRMDAFADGIHETAAMMPMYT
jgi:hypothetical protein